MNAFQKVVVSVGMVVILAMLAVPPWSQHWRVWRSGSGIVRVEPAGYAPLFQPPQGRDGPWSVEVDTTRLTIQVVAAVIATAGLTMVLSGRKQTAATPETADTIAKGEDNG